MVWDGEGVRKNYWIVLVQVAVGIVAYLLVLQGKHNLALTMVGISVLLMRCITGRFYRLTWWLVFSTALAVTAFDMEFWLRVLAAFVSVFMLYKAVYEKEE